MEKTRGKENSKVKNAKKKIYKYLDRRPKSSLSDLREAFPKVNPGKVSQYHLFWNRKQKQSTHDEKKNAAISPRKLKEMIFNYLDQNAESTTEQLYRAFPSANKSSISSYLGHWKKKQTAREVAKEGSLFQVLFRYLDENPSASIDDIQKVFTDVHWRSIEIYYQKWHRKQEEQENKLSMIVEEIEQDVFVPATEDTKPVLDKALDISADDAAPAVKNQPAAVLRSKVSKIADEEPQETQSKAIKQARRKPLKQEENEPLDSRVPALPPSESQMIPNVELIQTLKETIQAQKTTITELETEYSMISEKQTEFLSNLEELEQDDHAEFKSFLLTYIKGLNNS